MFTLITLLDGTKVISDFEKLSGIRKLASDVMSGRKAFPVWSPVSTVHPVSGEPVLIRRREFINGVIVARMEIVEPMIEDHGFDAANFQPVAIMQKGLLGTFTAPDADSEDAIEGAMPGIEYPVHRKPDTLQRYIILSYSEDEAEQVVHMLDPEPEDAGSRETHSFGDDDDDDDGEYDEDEEANS